MKWWPPWAWFTHFLTSVNVQFWQWLSWRKIYNVQIILCVMDSFQDLELELRISCNHIEISVRGPTLSREIRLIKIFWKSIQWGCVFYIGYVIKIFICRMERHMLICSMLLHLSSLVQGLWMLKILLKELIWFLILQKNWIVKDILLPRTLLRVHQILILHLLPKFFSTGEKHRFPHHVCQILCKCTYLSLWMCLFSHSKHVISFLNIRSEHVDSWSKFQR